jgi:hypothetical protein
MFEVVGVVVFDDDTDEEDGSTMGDTCLPPDTIDSKKRKTPG